VILTRAKDAKIFDSGHLDARRPRSLRGRCFEESRKVLVREKGFVEAKKSSSVLFDLGFEGHKSNIVEHREMLRIIDLQQDILSHIQTLPFYFNWRDVKACWNHAE